MAATAKAVIYSLAFTSALQPSSLRACAACYGQSDSPLAQGFNWGILSLLGVVVAVLGGIAAFFIFLARRSALQPPSPGAGDEPLLNDPQSPITDYR